MREHISASSKTSETEWKSRRFQLLKLFIFFTLLAPAFFYSINWFFYPPTNPSLKGVAMVYAGYMGTTIGALIWAFFPVWIYRIIIFMFKKNYDRRYELAFLIGGGIFAVIGLYGSQLK